MSSLKLNGKILETSPVMILQESKRKYQRIRILEARDPDALGRMNGKDNIFDCFIYGDKEILELWSTYRDDLESPPVTVLGSLAGRIKKSGNSEYNNVTIKINKLIFHYDTIKERPKPKQDPCEG